MKTISKDTPLMELTLRRYEKPASSNKRDLIRKFCLSVGLLQPGDSRDIIVDILYVLLEAQKNKEELTSDEIQKRAIEVRNEYKLKLHGVAPSNVRRQIKRLRDLLLVEKVKNNYRIMEFNTMHANFKEKITAFLLPSVLNRVEEYFKKIDESF